MVCGFFFGTCDYVYYIRYVSKYIHNIDCRYILLACLAHAPFPASSTQVLDQFHKVSLQVSQWGGFVGGLSDYALTSALYDLRFSPITLKEAGRLQRLRYLS